MKLRRTAMLLSGLAFLLSACGAKCPPERISYANDLSLFPPTGAISEYNAATMEIKGKPVQVDRVITGPVCNEIWSGNLYVTCDIRIPVWERDPFFFQDCDFEVEDGTIVYVEAHNDKMYDNGCSCHE
jgi:hypothetical protein